MKQFSLGPDLYFGAGALSALSALAGKRVFVVSDAFLVSSGLMERVTARLEGSAVEIFDRVTPDPPLRLVAEGVERLRAFAPEAIVAFGGGSPMDCAKGIRRFARGEGEATLPLWCVPTTAGTGSEVTAFAVLTDPEAGVKYPLAEDALLPDAAVLDPALLAGVPPAVTADTGMDVLAHAAEAAVATRASAFTDALAGQAFSLAMENLAGARRGEGAAREQMLLASCMAGIAFQNAGLGICHGLSHALGGRWHVPHGRLNAVLLPHVIRFNARARHAAAGYASLARRCGLSGAARGLAAAVERLRGSLGMPGSLTGCGIPGGELLGALDSLTEAALGDICTGTNPVPPDERALGALLREAM